MGPMGWFTFNIIRATGTRLSPARCALAERIATVVGQLLGAFASFKLSRKKVLRFLFVPIKETISLLVSMVPMQWECRINTLWPKRPITGIDTESSNIPTRRLVFTLSTSCMSLAWVLQAATIQLSGAERDLFSNSTSSSEDDQIDFDSWTAGDYLPPILFVLVRLSFQIGLAPYPWIYGNELFPLDLRSYLCSITSSLEPILVIDCSLQKIIIYPKHFFSNLLWSHFSQFSLRNCSDKFSKILKTNWIFLKAYPNGLYTWAELCNLFFFTFTNEQMHQKSSLEGAHICCILQ